MNKLCELARTSVAAIAISTLAVIPANAYGISDMTAPMAPAANLDAAFDLTASVAATLPEAAQQSLIETAAAQIDPALDEYETAWLIPVVLGAGAIYYVFFSKAGQGVGHYPAPWQHQQICWRPWGCRK